MLEAYAVAIRAMANKSNDRLLKEWNMHLVIFHLARQILHPCEFKFLAEYVLKPIRNQKIQLLWLYKKMIRNLAKLGVI